MGVSRNVILGSVEFFVNYFSKLSGLVFKGVFKKWV